MTNTPNDITCVYYTAGTISPQFADNMMVHLLEATGDIPLIIIRKDENIPANHFQIYRQALEGAKQATTPYIALCEDDELYSPEHFKYRPRNAPFAYNLGYWGIYTWKPPMYQYKGRKNLGNLICLRQAFIDAIEERFAKYPNPEGQALQDIWAEPSRYERMLGVSIQESEDFYTNPPNIKFSHQTELSFAGLGTRKRAGNLQAEVLPFWGSAENLLQLYE